MSDLTLLVISDVHYAPGGEAEPADIVPFVPRGEFVRRIVRDARRRGGFDAVIFPGDLVEHGHEPGGAGDLEAFATIVADCVAEEPVIAVPGNHDGEAGRFLAVIGDRAGPHEMGGYVVYSFADAYDEFCLARRSDEARRRFAECARSCGGKPIIALQHSVVHPPVKSEKFDFTHGDRDPVMASYAEAGVLLSVSGHSHGGGPVTHEGGVAYYTTRSSPRYALIHFEGRSFRVDEHTMILPEHPRIVDVHAHTHYAYCAEDVTARAIVQRSMALGLAGVQLNEHSDQLYLTADEYRARCAVENADTWVLPGSDESERMRDYRAEVDALLAETEEVRPGFLRLSLEVELDALRRPALRPEDRRDLEMLVGAVHWMPVDVHDLSASELRTRFLEDIESLLATGCRVLAHPFRFFGRRHVPMPPDLYAPVLDLLVRHGAAAEINFHTNRPAPEFFALCIERGIRIALGSDAHNLLEVGDFYPHLDLLAGIADGRDLQDLLFPAPDTGDDSR